MIADARGRLVQGDGLSLWVTEYGDPDARAIVLVHGYPDTSAVWAPVAQRLSATNHVVAYDVRGAGRSGVPTNRDGYRMKHLVADLGAVLRATSPDRAVRLVGHDWGSLQCWDALTGGTLEGRISAYTSISGPPLDHAGRWIRDRLSLDPQQLRQLVDQGLHSWYIYAFQVPRLPEMFWRSGMAKRLAKALEEQGGAKPDEEWPAATLDRDGAHGVELYRANVFARTRHPHDATTSVPVQVIVATKDRYVTPALLEGLERRAPNLTWRHLDAGHWAIRTHPDQIADWVDGFPGS